MGSFSFITFRVKVIHLMFGLVWNLKWRINLFLSVHLTLNVVLLLLIYLFILFPSFFPKLCYNFTNQTSQTSNGDKSKVDENLVSVLMICTWLDKLEQESLPAFVSTLDGFVTVLFKFSFIVVDVWSRHISLISPA